MKLGLALSGGGMRGIAHAGVLKALEENDIKIDVIGGTSAGSIIATLYAMGYSPYYIYILFKRYAQELANKNFSPAFTSINNFITNKKVQFLGFNTGEDIEKLFNDIALRKGIRNITDIKLPLAIPAVDIQTSKEFIFTNNVPENKNEKKEYITDITVGKAIRASSSFPIAFFPCEFGKYKFLDGGILNNVPADEVKLQGADKVISVNFRADNIDSKSTVMDIAMRAIDIMGNKISEDSLGQSDFILTIQTDKTGLLETEKLDSCYKYGYRQTMKNIKKIQSSVPSCSCTFQLTAHHN